jgi:hypothetical protein
MGPDGAWGILGIDDDGVNGIDDPGERGWPGSDDGDFVDLGNAGAFGFYSASALNAAPSISGPTGFCAPHPAYAALPTPVTRPLFRFDTWHPLANIDGVPPNDPPPFRAPIAGTTPRYLRAIQITITFFDTTTQTMRDVTFVQSVYSPP